MEYNCFYQSPVGQLELVSDGQNLTQLLFSNQQQPTERVNKASLPIFKQARSWLDTYFKENVHKKLFLFNHQEQHSNNMCGKN